MTLDLPMPPSLWKAYVRRPDRIGQATSSEYRRFQADCAWAMRAQKATLPPGPAFSVHVDLVSPNWLTKDGGIRKVDAENRLKPLIDAMTSFFQATRQPFDDSQIVDLRVTKIRGQRERAVVRIEQGTLCGEDPS